MRGYKTEGRAKIMEILEKAEGTPLSVPQIRQRLQEMGASLNKTTVYRNLDRLEEGGQVVRYSGDNGEKALFQLVDPRTRCDQHIHLKCMGCGDMIHTDGEFMNDITQQIYTEHGFMIRCCNSVIYGLCPKCLQKEWEETEG